MSEFKSTTTAHTFLSTKTFVQRTEKLRDEALLRGRPPGFVLGIITEEDVEEEEAVEVPQGIAEVPQVIQDQDDCNALLAAIPPDAPIPPWDHDMKWWCPHNARQHTCPGLEMCTRMRVCGYFHREGLTGEMRWLKHKEVSLQLCFVSTRTP